MAPAPFVTRATTSESGGLAWSRFGPTAPCAFASASVWHPTQPADANTCLPAVASPFLYCVGTVAVWAFGTVPTTVCGVGVTTFSPGFDVEHPADTARSGTTSAIGRRRR